MPELPEVETCARALARWTAGRVVVACEVVDPRSVRDGRTDRPTRGSEAAARLVASLVTGRAPGSLSRHGKRLWWQWPEGGLLLHLGMTGKWTRRPTPFTRLRLVLDDGSAVCFSDPRLLGGVVPGRGDDGPRWLRDGLGPDALRDGLPPLRGQRPVKVALLDQAVVAGLGNLHAAEALWRAGIDPRQPAGTVGDRHPRLAAAVAEQLRLALAALGSDDEVTYVDDPGAPNPFPVYRRAGQPCPRCGALIARLLQAGRSTYWCPGCQR